MATLVNVLGARFSGTTMLDLMLGSGEDSFSCGEVYAWYRPHRSHHFKIQCTCGESPCPVWNRLSAVPEDLFHSTVARELGVWFIVDSSKNLRWVLDSHVWARRSGLRVFNVAVWKDPVELYYSHWKRGMSLHSSQKAFLGYYLKLLGLGLPFVSLSYSSLVESPSDTISQLCNLVGMECFSGKENFWQWEHHQIFGNLGTRRQVEASSSSFKPPGEFPPDFLPLLNRVRESTESDSVMIAVIKALRERELFGLCESKQMLHKNYSVPRIKPLWYYRDRLLSSLRRLFPHKYESHSQEL